MRRLVDLLSFCSLHIIGRNHSVTFLLINRRKLKLFLRKHCIEGYFFWYHDIESLDRFLSLLNIYFSDVQINRWLYLSRSLWGIPLRCDLFRKGIDPKNFLLLQQTTELTVLAVRRSVRYFLPVVFPRYSGKVVEKRRWTEAITKRYAFQANAIRSNNGHESGWLICFIGAGVSFILSLLHYF